MNVTINALHCSIPNRLRTTAFERMERLTRFHPRLADAHVTFDRDAGAPEVEARLAVDGARPLVARAAADSFERALERVSDRLERQLKRTRARTARRPYRRYTPSTPDA